MSDDSSEPWDGVVTTEALRAWARRVPDSADGTERLCFAVYGRPAQPRDFLGGSQAHMLHDAADTIAALRAVVDAAREAEAERDALRERVRVLEAVAVAARREGDLFLCDAEDFGSLPNCNAAGAPESLCMPCALRVAFAALDALDAAETDTREPDDGKVRVSLVEAVKLVKSLPDPSREVKRISEWNRLYREQRGGDR